jgi:membrane protease YdiL (CAAX protease family)
VRLIPLSLARQLTLDTYLCLVHAATLLLGVGVSLLLLQKPLGALGLVVPSPRAIGWALLLAPVVYVASSYVAIGIALPTLMDELRRGGRELVQKSTGEFGRTITQSPVPLAVLWAVVVSPISEELLFRGAIWGALQRLADRLRPEPREVAPGSLEIPIADSLGARWLRGTASWLVGGGIATLATAALFAALHADMPGGLGIVRVASAFGIGLACGVARHHSGAIWAPVALHVAYNALSLATTRRWVVSEAFPLKLGVPTLLSLLAGVCLLLAVVALVVRRLRRA